MSDTSLETIIRTKFSSHRGVAAPGVELNSLSAIFAAFALEPPFIEFDVAMAKDGVVRTGHPPQDLMVPLGTVLDLFHEHTTYPKIDMKPLVYTDTQIMIDEVLTIVFAKKLPLVLITLESDNVEHAEYLHLQRYLAERIQGNPSVRLSFDIVCIDGFSSDKAGAAEHMRAIEDSVAAVAAEIHKVDFDTVGRFARTYGIPKIEFWLTGSLDVSGPSVTEETIRKALALEERYDVRVYFDMDRRRVVSTEKQT